ncbi:hypothetical protein V6N12_021983 [Hibiscus sabdariffa]|uniref:K-box domain-containing protein n=1 Tax=Hibiscus sabdariffa TaxID=183260 RepID=A0ABR2FTB6_9ROSI
MDRTVAKYRRDVGLPDSSNPQFRTMEFWRSEIEELKRSISTLEARQKHISGEDILTLGMRELKQLERQLKVGVERVRSRKVRIFRVSRVRRRIVSDHATLLKRKVRNFVEYVLDLSVEIILEAMISCVSTQHKQLQEENTHLQKRSWMTGIAAQGVKIHAPCSSKAFLKHLCMDWNTAGSLEKISLTIQTSHCEHRPPPPRYGPTRGQ